MKGIPHDSPTDTIRDLIAKGDLDSAIITLSSLASSNKAVNEVLLQSSMNEILKKQLRHGTIDFQDSEIQRNRINKSILDILDLIDEEKKQRLDSDAYKYPQIDIEFKIIATIKDIYELTKEILKENQEILTPILLQRSNKLIRKIKLFLNNTKDNDRFEVMNKMIILFNNQKSRGTFSRWIVFFNEIVYREDLPQQFKNEANKMGKLLTELNNTLYSRVSSARINQINSIFYDDPYLENQENKEIISRIVLKDLFRHQIMYSDEKINLLVDEYLENLRNIHVKISEILEKLKLLSS